MTSIKNATIVPRIEPREFHAERIGSLNPPELGAPDS
jgi:hypothetical protein